MTKRADELRAHRHVFEYARAHNITLLQARAALAKLRQRAAADFVHQLQNRPVTPPVAPPTHHYARCTDGAPWMLRD